MTADLTKESEEWSCPICMSLLYKPTAAVCGHLFCFWCMHRAMSPFNSSKCPLCRSTFGHFPDVCNIIHCFLLQAFPEQYETRAEETRENEAEEEVDSVEVELPPTVGENAWAQAVLAKDPRWSLADFLCARPGCGRLLRKPVVLNCGCCVCAAGCQPPAVGDACARCGAISVTQPRPCTKLKDLVRELFPTKDYDARIEARRPPPAPAEETGCGVCQQQCPEQQQQQQQGAKRKTPVGDHEAEQEDGGRKSPSPPAPAAERAPQPDQATRTPVNDLAEGDQGEEADQDVPSPSDNTAAAIHRRLVTASATITHFGIGCDFCGMYPIVGERWQCLDCPERVGFDLCGACYQRRSNVTGRFNQHHTAEHRMQKKQAAPHLLHVLQAANPEMDMSQIVGMLQMAWDPDEGENAGDEDPPIPHTHRGGPRPAPAADPFAPGNLANAALLTHVTPALAAAATALSSLVEQDALAGVDPAAAELQAVRARRQAAAAQASATTGTQRRGGGDAPGEAPPPAPAPPGEGSLPAALAAALGAGGADAGAAGEARAEQLVAMVTGQAAQSAARQPGARTVTVILPIGGALLSAEATLVPSDARLAVPAQQPPLAADDGSLAPAEHGQQPLSAEASTAEHEQQQAPPQQQQAASADEGGAASAQAAPGDSGAERRTAVGRGGSGGEENDWEMV